MSNETNIIRFSGNEAVENLHVHADGSVVISCGLASIKLHQNGAIQIDGTHLILNGNEVRLNGEIHLN